MTNIIEIEEAVQSLSPQDFRVLFDWMIAKDNEIWDSKLEKDIMSGKLDFLAEDAILEFNNGQTRPI